MHENGMIIPKIIGLCESGISVFDCFRRKHIRNWSQEPGVCIIFSRFSQKNPPEMKKTVEILNGIGYNLLIKVDRRFSRVYYAAPRIRSEGGKTAVSHRITRESESPQRDIKKIRRNKK